MVSQVPGDARFILPSTTQCQRDVQRDISFCKKDEGKLASARHKGLNILCRKKYHSVLFQRRVYGVESCTLPLFEVVL